MPYDPITLLSQLDGTIPAGTEAANILDDALRQTRAFIKAFLAVSLDDAGALKANSVGASQISTGAVGTTELADASVTAAKLTSDAVSSTTILDGSITAAKLATDAVETVKIKALNVTEAKLASSSVTTTKIADANVTSAKMAVDSVLTTAIAAGNVTEAKIADGAVTAGKLGVITGATIGVPVVGTTTASNKMAQIGGALTATLDTGTVPPTLLFALASLGSSSTTIVLLQEVATGAIAANAPGDAVTTWTKRGTWSVPVGSSAVTLTGSDFTILAAGTYLVYFSVPGYSIGCHVAALYDVTNAAIIATAEHACAGLGAQTSSQYFGVLTVAAASTKYCIYQWAELAKTTNGKGLIAGSTVASPVLATVSLIKL